MATTSPPHLASSLTCHQDNHLRSHSHSQSESQSADSDFILQLFPYMAPSATALSAADLSKLPPFPPIERPLYDGAHYSIGRRVDKKRKSAFDEADDGADHDEAMICFRSKVVSRQHAELWYDNGMVRNLTIEVMRKLLLIVKHLLPIHSSTSATPHHLPEPLSIVCVYRRLESPRGRTSLSPMTLFSWVWIIRVDKRICISVL